MQPMITSFLVFALSATVIQAKPLSKLRAQVNANTQAISTLTQQRSDSENAMLVTLESYASTIQTNAQYLENLSTTVSQAQAEQTSAIDEIQANNATIQDSLESDTYTKNDLEQLFYEISLAYNTTTTVIEAAQEVLKTMLGDMEHVKATTESVLMDYHDALLNGSASAIALSLINSSNGSTLAIINSSIITYNHILESLIDAHEEQKNLLLALDEKIDQMVDDSGYDITRDTMM